ncbi:hypothetical protein AVEN_206348-1 [Araneus ventricosus]|uniref:Uncharacterized protein n=1 Tax=Araneus ventricosus TaxID=182803 RepID=A0A4Y2JFL3_ARAVE|nr:hypothetical protein AVEN_206348-1 [Araneus ventricosus]
MEKWRYRQENLNITPSVSFRPTNWIRENVIFFSQHGPFSANLKTFRFSDSDHCSCGGIGTALHYATECALTVSWHMRKPSAKLRTRMAEKSRQ